MLWQAFLESQPFDSAQLLSSQFQPQAFFVIHSEQLLSSQSQPQAFFVIQREVTASLSSLIQSPSYPSLTRLPYLFFPSQVIPTSFLMC